MFHSKIKIVIFFSYFVWLSGCSQLPTPYPISVPKTPPPPKPLKDVRVALVLSGGGARALAHAGVLEVLEENHIPIDLIAGSSAGSLVGALYADEPQAQKLKSKIIKLNKWDFLDLDWSSSMTMFWQAKGLVEGEALRLYLQRHIHAKDFSELKIPLAVVTTDLLRGEAFVLSSGPLIPALHASSAIPMLFSPVRIYGRTLVDGGVVSPVPVEVAKKYAPKLIIAVDIGTPPDKGYVKNNYQIAMRSIHIPYSTLAHYQLKEADIVIKPVVQRYSLFADYANQEMYEAGKRAAKNALPQIEKALKADQKKYHRKA